MSNSGVVVATLVVYQLVLLGIGYWAKFRSTNAREYLIGDHGLGPWVAALSYAAGSSSAWSILGVSGIAFVQGVSAFWLLPGTLAGHLVVWFLIAPRLQGVAKSKGWITLTDVIAEGLPEVTRAQIYKLSAVIILFSFTFYIAAQFQGAASTFEAVFELDFAASLVLGALVVVTYTIWGGFWAVSLTDALQALLMFAACIVLPWAAVDAVGGLGAVFDAFYVGSAADTFWLFSGGHQGWFVVGFFLGMLSIGFGPLGQPHLLNRVMALKNRRDINLARTIALVWFSIVLGGMFLLGLVGHLILQSEPGEAVFFVLAESLLPPIFTGVLIAAVLSAIMSTADSQLLVAGSAVQSQNSSMTSFRIAIVGVAVAAVLLALFLPESIFSRVLFAWNALGAAFGPPLIAKLWQWRVRSAALPLAMVLGFGLTILFYTLPNGPGDLWERAIPFLVGLGVLRMSIVRGDSARP
jgi:sodium/proline symporter